MRYLTPLRYPGGKAKLANFIKLVLRSNDLLDGHYVEPYAGGAGVAVALLTDEYVSRIHINDVDDAVYAFWNSVLNHTDALCRRVRNTNVTAAEWQRQRAVYNAGKVADPVELGFATFFLNRTNRSGIIASGGMIGGKAQGGKWKLDARYNAPELVRRIERIARYRDRISLTNLDAVTLLARLIPKLPAKCLYYLDPPYYVKGKRRLYATFYEPADHERVAELITGAGRSWIVAYDDAPEIRRLYRGFPRVAYGLQYSVSERYEGEEMMFFSHDLSLPRVGSPATVTAAEVRQLELIA